MASGIYVSADRRVREEPPQKWVDILFSGRTWEPETGLYVSQQEFAPYSLMSHGLIPGDNGKWVGGGFEFAGFQLIVLVEASASVLNLEGQIHPLTYHPATITIDSGRQKTEIQLRWQNGAPSNPIRFQKIR